MTDNIESFVNEKNPLIASELSSRDFYRLVKMAVRDGILEAHSRTSTSRADSVAKQLLGG